MKYLSLGLIAGIAYYFYQKKSKTPILAEPSLNESSLYSPDSYKSNSFVSFGIRG